MASIYMPKVSEACRAGTAACRPAQRMLPVLGCGKDVGLSDYLATCQLAAVKLT